MAFSSAVAYLLVNPEGATQSVRWRLAPEAGQKSLPESERESADPD